MKDSSGKNVPTDEYNRSQATRPQVPQDKYYAGVNHWQSGTAVPGARLSVIDFSDRPNDYRNSPISKPEKPRFKE